MGIPPERGRRLHEAIPGSRLETIPRCSHPAQEDATAAAGVEHRKDFFGPYSGHAAPIHPPSGKGRSPKFASGIVHGPEPGSPPTPVIYPHVGTSRPQDVAVPDKDANRCMTSGQVLPGEFPP